MKPRGTDPVSIVAGVVVTGLGLLVLLDQTGVLDLRFGTLGPALLAALGAVLLVSGLSRD